MNEDEITIELDKFVKAGLMKRIEHNGEWKYAFTEIGNIINDKLTRNVPLTTTELEHLKLGGLDSHTLRKQLGSEVK